MTAVSALVKRRPVAAYFALTFAISWTNVLIVIGPGGIPGTSEQVERLFPIALLALLTGPALAGLLLTGLVRGRTGLRELGSRLFYWRVEARWYAIAILTAPVAMIVLLPLSLISPEFIPDVFTEGLSIEETAALLLIGIGVGLFGGFLEEIGWTGFATPALQQRYGVRTTGLIVGLLWGMWHFPMNAWMSGTFAGNVSLTVFIPLYVFAGTLQLMAVRVLMVWVNDQIDGSLLVVVLMHASLIASTSVVFLPQVTGISFLVFVLAVAAAFWILVGAVHVSNGGQLERERPQTS